MERTPEQEAWFEIGGPGDVVLDWLEAVRFEDPKAWALMTTDFRLVLLQTWITIALGSVPMPIPQVVADDLEMAFEDSPDSDAFPWVLKFACAAILTSFRADPAEFVLSRRPRPVAPELEVVRLYHRGDVQLSEEGGATLPTGATARAISAPVVHTTAGWLVAGIGHKVARPGWPPTWEQVAASND